MKAIRFNFTIPRYALGLAVGRFFPPLLWSGLSCTYVDDLPEPSLPGDDWVLVETRFGGICGSDMSTIHLEPSPYYIPLNSFPFTFGHENVGRIAQVGSKADELQPGERVVVEPLLWCTPRGFDDLCPYCARGEINRCLRNTDGDLPPGLMIGTTHSTGGAWSRYFLAHASQVYRLPDEVDDENGVIVEPFSVGLHAALMGFPDDSETVLIIGAGSIGLFTLASLRNLGSRAEILVLARYPFQADAARKLGASQVISAGRGQDTYASVAALAGARLLHPPIGKPVVVGGVDRVFECVGSSASLNDALHLTRQGGQVILVGVPGIARGVDWTPFFAKELVVRAAYTYHHAERFAGQRFKTYAQVIEWLERGAADMSWMITHRYHLEDYQRALSQLSRPGKSGAIKGVFEFPT